MISLRRYLLPHLVIPSSFGLPLVVAWCGTRPSQAARRDRIIAPIRPIYAPQPHRPVASAAWLYRDGRKPSWLSSFWFCAACGVARGGGRGVTGGATGATIGPIRTEGRNGT